MDTIVYPYSSTSTGVGQYKALVYPHAKLAANTSKNIIRMMVICIR